uniref:RRM domain-containing protein n=1 Tax=Cuerna arida TaxID=1464854 RepID=A0A1B6F632_9HEMI
MSTLEELGNQAYQKALWNDFKGAITILDKAIAKYPRDPRLYNNRCYSYCRLKDYKSALSEAEFMVKEFPSFSKGYYRKAEILIEMKRYIEAELVLHEILKLEPNCQEAKFLLSEVQLMLLCSGGKYSVHDSIRALQLTNFNTEQAKAFLEVGGMKGANSYDKNDIYYSDEELEEPSTSSAPVAKVTTEEGEYDPYVDPSNPFKSNSIWVGNVTKKITEDSIKPIFSKFGKIKSIIVQHQNFCAFVNYMEPSMAANAMKKFQQNYPVADTVLVIRYPDNAKANAMMFGNKKNGIKIK